MWKQLRGSTREDKALLLPGVAERKMEEELMDSPVPCAYCPESYSSVTVGQEGQQ